MFRSSLLLACNVGLSVGLDCQAITDPNECVQALPSTCSWMVLDGSCASHHSTLAQESPSTCCGSLVEGSHCSHQTGSIPDGACRLSFFVDRLSAPRFDLDYATRMTHIASASYCESDVATWSCGFHCDAVQGLSMIQYVYYHPANLAGFVAWDSQQDAIIVSFRGTQGTSIKNWIKNLDAITTKPFSQYPDAKVHKGFYQSWLDLSPNIMAAVANVQEAHGGTTKVYVTGHSLGAAIASIAAFDMKLNYGFTPSLIDLGRPRIGNHVFTEAIMGEISSVFRMTHHDDLVPHAPAEFMGFYHSGDEQFFQGDDTSYVTCDGSGEDDSCSNRCAPLFCVSVSDHVHYLGMSIGSDACGSSAVV